MNYTYQDYTITELKNGFHRITGPNMDVKLSPEDDPRIWAAHTLFPIEWEDLGSNVSIAKYQDKRHVLHPFLTWDYFITSSTGNKAITSSTMAGAKQRAEIWLRRDIKWEEDLEWTTLIPNQLFTTEWHNVSYILTGNGNYWQLHEKGEEEDCYYLQGKSAKQKATEWLRVNK